MFSVSGSQFVVGQGKRFNFAGESGKTYDLFTSGPTSVTGRVKKCDSSEATYYDRMTIKTGEHAVRVDHESVLVDGNPPSEAQCQPGGPIWVQQGQRATVGVDGYLIGVFLDDGSGDDHANGALKGVPHVSLTVVPQLSAEAKGILVDGDTGSPADYVVG